MPSRIRKLPTSTTQTPGVVRAPARIEPLSRARYQVQLTASAALRDKIARATDLMRHRNPSGDLAVVIERAVDALLEKLESETRGKTARPGLQQRNARRGRTASLAPPGARSSRATASNAPTQMLRAAAVRRARSSRSTTSSRERSGIERPLEPQGVLPAARRPTRSLSPAKVERSWSSTSARRLEPAVGGGLTSASLPST